MLIFFGFLRPDLSPWQYSNTCFLAPLCYVIVRRPNLEVATKRLLHQQIKYGDSFSAMLRTEVCPSSYFRYSGYFWGPWASFATTYKLSVRVIKLLQGLVSHELTVYFCLFFKLLLWIMVILSKRYIPGNFEPHNSLKHSFTNIRRLRSSFVEWESFLESSRPDILALCEANLDDSGNFSVKCYLPLIQKDSITHMHGLALYVKEGFPFTRDLSQEDSDYLRFRLALLHSSPYLISFFVVMQGFWFYFI